MNSEDNDTSSKHQISQSFKLWRKDTKCTTEVENSTFKITKDELPKGLLLNPENY